jgi:hypothetical protein
VGITVTTLTPGTYGHEENTMQTWRADRTLWLNAARDAVVEDGEPDAAFLYATKGKTVPLAGAERYGLTGARKQAPQPRDKQGSQPPNKQANSATDYSNLKQPQLKALLTARGIGFPSGIVANKTLVELLAADDAARGG